MYKADKIASVEDESEAGTCTALVPERCCIKGVAKILSSKSSTEMQHLNLRNCGLQDTALLTVERLIIVEKLVITVQSEESDHG